MTGYLTLPRMQDELSLQSSSFSLEASSDIDSNSSKCISVEKSEQDDVSFNENSSGSVQHSKTTMSPNSTASESDSTNNKNEILDASHCTELDSLLQFSSSGSLISQQNESCIIRGRNSQGSSVLSVSSSDCNSSAASTLHLDTSKLAKRMHKGKVKSGQSRNATFGNSPNDEAFAKSRDYSRNYRSPAKQSLITRFDETNGSPNSSMSCKLLENNGSETYSVKSELLSLQDYSSLVSVPMSDSRKKLRRKNKSSLERSSIDLKAYECDRSETAKLFDKKENQEPEKFVVTKSVKKGSVNKVFNDCRRDARSIPNANASHSKDSPSDKKELLRGSVLNRAVEFCADSKDICILQDKNILQKSCGPKSKTKEAHTTEIGLIDQNSSRAKKVSKAVVTTTSSAAFANDEKLKCPRESKQPEIKGVNNSAFTISDTNLTHTSVPKDSTSTWPEYYAQPNLSIRQKLEVLNEVVQSTDQSIRSFGTVFNKSFRREHLTGTRSHRSISSRNTLNDLEIIDSKQKSALEYRDSYNHNMLPDQNSELRKKHEKSGDIEKSNSTPFTNPLGNPADISGIENGSLITNLKDSSNCFQNTTKQERVSTSNRVCQEKAVMIAQMNDEQNSGNGVPRLGECRISRVNAVDPSNLQIKGTALPLSIAENTSQHQIFGQHYIAQTKVDVPNTTSEVEVKCNDFNIQEILFASPPPTSSKTRNEETGNQHMINKTEFGVSSPVSLVSSCYSQPSFCTVRVMEVKNTTLYENNTKEQTVATPGNNRSIVQALSPDDILPSNSSFCSIPPKSLETELKSDNIECTRTQIQNPSIVKLTNENLSNNHTIQNIGAMAHDSVKDVDKSRSKPIDLDENEASKIRLGEGSCGIHTQPSGYSMSLIMTQNTELKEQIKRLELFLESTHQEHKIKIENINLEASKRYVISTQYLIFTNIS